MNKLLHLLFNSTLNSVIFGIMLLLGIGAYVAIGSGIPEVRERFEMNEIQFFNAWPLKVLMLLLVVTLATVTWIRIPLTPPRYGVWCIHLGIITLVISTSFHYRHKVEGMTIVPIGATVDHFYDVTERSLYARVPGRPIGWKPMVDLPRFKTYTPELGSAGALARASLTNIAAVSALDPFTGEEQQRDLAELVGAPAPVKLDVVAYHPYADVVTTYDEDPASGPTGVRLGLHSESDHSDTSRYLVFDDPDAQQADVGGVTVAHQHFKTVVEVEEARKASVESLSKLHRLDVQVGALEQTLNVQIGGDYKLGDTGYSLQVESFDPAFPAMNGEIVQLLTMMVKSPTQTFRRQVISKRENPTDWKLGVAGAGPLGKRQTEPLDQELKTFYLYKDEASLMPTTARERYTFLTAGDDAQERVVVVYASTDRASFVRDVSPGEQFELRTEKAPTMLTVSRVTHVRRRDEIVDVPKEKRISDEGQSGRRQVLAVKVSSGAWSQVVPVPASQWPQEMLRVWGGPVIQVPGAARPMRLQVGNTLRRLPSRVTLDQFELVPFPGGEAGKSNMYRDFKSHLTVQEYGRDEPIKGVAHMNSPVYLDAGRWPFNQSWLLFQAQWDPQGQRWSVLGVGSRPGVGVMTLGCVMIGVGLLYAFYAKPYIIRRMKLRALAEHQEKQSHTKARSRGESDMKNVIARIIVLLIALVGTSASAQTTATDAFADAVDLAPLAKVSVLHNQALKTFDSYARQTLTTVTGRASLDGRGAVFSVLDIAFRPEAYAGRNLIQVKNVPLRMDFDRIQSIDAVEKARILTEGKISLLFWFKPEVQAWAEQLQSSAVFKAKALEQVQSGALTLRQICRPFPTFPEAAILPPSPTESPRNPWRNINEIAGNVPWWADAIRNAGMAVPARIDGYDDKLLDDLSVVTNDLARAWSAQDATAVNVQIVRVAELLPKLNPAIYPSDLKRSAEVMYNRLAKMTLPGVMFYFIAFSCFLLAARSSVTSLRLWGLRFFVVGFLIHTFGIAVRWWLVEKSTDDWFHSIPIRNQFESVMMSAWFGAALGLFLEMKFTRSIFGAAASFVGWLSLLAIFAAPFVTGREIGGEIGQVSGVLMSYWLYIHVTTVTASYALIGMSFMLGIWWLVRYYRNFGTLSRQPARQLSSDASDMDYMSTSVNGGAIVRPTVLGTLAQLLWVRRADSGRVVSTTQSRAKALDPTQSMLSTLDLCNLVILQLVVLTLGVGTILGAVWADMSWGRPWGWDPKETFALVTLIVYLVILHVRLVSENKAWWTSVLAIVGFFVMLFNWIGVNFFLVGLHSYA